MSLTVALRSAQSAILGNQAAIGATAKNIANVNTEGYSRKLVNFENRVLAGAGAGVDLSKFTRAVDESLLKDLRRELAETNLLSSQDTYFRRLQDLFGAPEDNNSISHVMNEFTQAAESLSLSPNQALNQNEFIRQASEVALKLRKMTQEIQELRGQADWEIQQAVAEVNSLAAEIADANNKIIRAEAVNGDTTELKDKRDLALNKLSELVDIQTFPRSSGDIVVFTSDGFTLVDATANSITHSAAGVISTTTTYASGDLTGIYAGAVNDSNDFTNRMSGGQLAGLVKQRDETLPNLQFQLDELATELTEAINELHNRGTAFPGLQSMTGTRSFIDSANQTIQIDPTNGTADVTISLFNTSGEQQATTTLNTIMTSGIYGTGPQTDHGKWSVDEVAQTIQDWYQKNGATSASVEVSANGKLVVDLNKGDLFTSFRDEIATAEGSDQSDIEISFDANGDGNSDETASGFSNFFGLNDLYVDSRGGSLYESAQLPDRFTFSTPSATLSFYDTTNGVGSGKEFGTFTVYNGTSLNEFVEEFNLASIGATASLIPDGSGSRLRILNDSGKEMVITQGAGETMLQDMSIERSHSISAVSLKVRDDILKTPALATTGIAQYNTGSNEYQITPGDNSIINSIAERLNTKNTFDQAGGLSVSTKTFTEYATSILSNNANLASINESRLQTQEHLSNTLDLEAKSISGVSLDEEMSNLILYQQAFSASARIISIIQQMFQALEDAV